MGGFSGMDEKSKFINCYNNNSTITYGSRAGGIVGYSSYSIYNNVKNTGQITGYTVGGIVGYSSYSIYNNVKNAGQITGYIVGGISGDVEDGQAINLSNSGNIIGIDKSGDHGMIGGLFGHVSSETTLFS